MELIDIVMKLNGPIQAVGETNADGERLKNLRSLGELAESLVGRIRDASETADRPEASMKAIGLIAKSYLVQISEICAMSDSKVRTAQESLKFVCDTMSECETIGSVEKYGSRAMALNARAYEIFARCSEAMKDLA